MCFFDSVKFRVNPWQMPLPLLILISEDYCLDVFNQGAWGNRVGSEPP